MRPLTAIIIGGTFIAMAGIIAHTVGVIAAAGAGGVASLADFVDDAELIWSTTVALPSVSSETEEVYSFNVDFSAHAGRIIAIAIADPDAEYLLMRTAGSRGASTDNSSLTEPFDVLNAFVNVPAIYAEFETPTVFRVGFPSADTPVPNTDVGGLYYGGGSGVYPGGDMLQLPSGASLKRIGVWLDDLNSGNSANAEIGFYALPE